MRNLDQMFETQNMEAGEVANKTTHLVNIMKLRSALDLCVENLPQFLELGQVPHLVTKQYDFPYHRPSIISLFSSSGTLLPETVGYVLLQVSSLSFMHNFFYYLSQQYRLLKFTLSRGSLKLHLSVHMVISAGT